MSARVLVTDARLPSALAVIRSLGRRGDHVIAADSDPKSPGLRSRYASERVVYPSPESDGGAFTDFVLELARERNVDLVVPVTDEAILPLDRARARFAGVTSLALPTAAALACARDKQETLALARRLGVPTPATAVVSTAAEARRQAASLGWPVVLKPLASRVVNGRGEIESLRVAYAGGFGRLAQHMARFEGLCPVLLQQYTVGEAFGVELLLSEGRPLAAFQHRRLREVPITGGASSFRESVPLDETLYDYATRLMAELGWTGLAMVEFKVGAAGPLLMEINGRIWGSLPLAVRAGMDFPARMADLYLHGAPAPNGGPASEYALGVRARNLDLEVVWIASVLAGARRYPFLRAPRRREALAAAVQLADTRLGYDQFVRDDPRPGFAELPRMVAKLSRKLHDR